MRRSMFGHQEHAGEIDGDAAIPGPERERLDGRINRVCQPGVVDQSVQPPETLHRRPDAGSHRRLARNADPAGPPVTMTAFSKFALELNVQDSIAPCSRPASFG